MNDLLDKILNSIQNGVEIKFSSSRTELSECDEEITDDENNDEEAKKKRKQDDTIDEEIVEIAVGADGSSVTADRIKSPSFFKVVQATYQSDSQLNKKLLSRTKEVISHVRKSFKKQESNMKSELSSKIHDLCKAMNDIINSEVRRSKYQDNGMAKALAIAFEPYAELSYALLSLVPTHSMNDEFNIQTQDLLDSVAEALTRVQNAKTYAERVIFLMSLGSQYRTLMQTHPMIKGEVNFVNGSGTLAPWNTLTYTDMWEYYLYDHNAIGNGEATKMRGVVGDNATQPDVCITKPFFLFFVDDELIYNLKKLHISDEALSVLGNYAMPTDLWPSNVNTSTSWEPENEDYTHSQVSTVATDNHLSISTEPTLGNRRNPFVWSHNGTLDIISKTPENIRGRNQAFINEVSNLIQLARSKAYNELSVDVCFYLVLTNWLNAVVKYMIDLNANFIPHIDKGVKTNLDRFISPSTTDIILKTLHSFIPHENAFKAASIMDLLFDSAEMEFDRVHRNGFRYSTVAYEFLANEFQSAVYTIGGDDEYYIGDTLVGKNNIIVSIIQKLYIPVDVLATPIKCETGFVSSNFNSVEHFITDPWMFAFATANTRFNKVRGVAESGVIMNFSLFHFIARLSNNQYSALIEDIYNNMTFTAMDNEERTLNCLFGFAHANSASVKDYSIIPHLRRLSPLTPVHNLSSLLHLAPCSTSPLDSDNGNYINGMAWMYPLWDEALNAPIGSLCNYDGTNQYRMATLGWTIQALVNKHCDFSWIEVGLLLSTLKSKLLFNLYQDPAMKISTTNVPVLGYRITSLGNNFYYDFNYTENASAPLYNIEYNALMRRAVQYENAIGWSNAFINNAFDHVAVSNPKTAISTADIMRAFRYSGYTYNDNGSNHFTLIDNKFGTADKTCPKTIYYNVCVNGRKDASQISQYHRLVRDSEEINITEQYIRDQLTTPDYLAEGLIVFDNYHKASNTFAAANNTIPNYNKCNDDTRDFVLINPDVIRNTNFISLDTNYNSLLYCISATEAKVDMRFNEFCYISTDFYPTQISYSVMIPFATKRSDISLHNHENATALNNFNNLRAFEIIANAFHRVGFDKDDINSTYSMLQALTGLDADLQIVPDDIIIRSEDRIYEVTAGVFNGKPIIGLGFGIYPSASDIDNKNNTISVDVAFDTLYAAIGARPSQVQSLKSSYRYPKCGIFPASATITGMPIFFDYINKSVTDEVVASRKAVSFFKKFNSIVPDQGYGLYRKPLDVSASSLFTIAINGNPNYNNGNVHDQLTISFTTREILKQLDIFFKDR